MTNAHRLILIGPQGSGKGTQGELLSVYLQIPTISTGELCRQATAGDTEEAKAIHAVMQSGALVSDELMFKLLRQRLEQIDAADGFILDGFPRNVAQAQAAIDWIKPSKVLVFDLDDNAAIARAAARRACSKCRFKTTANYVLTYGDVCPRCGASIVKRLDDDPVIVAKRLQSFHALTQPVIGFYAAAGLVARFDGSKKIPQVFAEIAEVL